MEGGSDETRYFAAASTKVVQKYTKESTRCNKNDIMLIIKYTYLYIARNRGIEEMKTTYVCLTFDNLVLALICRKICFFLTS